ncbi:hypothetical protein [uncultured Algoriphagus sp.]|uniref:hypothetical protein n=1 Tax=uncultured Algoriphagus sp. TaxID=417365 RepID=UPI0025949FFB|nr:hypothetical protein [uncultured Algoriphagus sp.]
MNNQILDFLNELKGEGKQSLVIQKKLVLEEDWIKFDIFDSISFLLGFIKIGYSSLDFMLIEYSTFEEVETKMVQIEGRNPLNINSIIGLNIFYYVNRALEEVMIANPTQFPTQKERLFEWERRVCNKIHKVKINRMFGE